MEQFVLEAGSIKVFDTPVVHLGIQGAPQTICTINSQGKINIGPTGIFELDLENKGSYITSVEAEAKVIIDVKYLKGGE